MKKIPLFLLSIILAFSCMSVPFKCYASNNESYEEEVGDRLEISTLSNAEIHAKSAVLIEATTGTLLYAKNPNEALPPASVTKIMTLLIVVEALANGEITLTDKVSVSANASSMGGSQIFLKEGEIFTVEELLKSTIIASANDAAVALAEFVAGSEEAFVDLMNKKAEALGLKNTYFENTTGLDDETVKHLTSAYDIGIMSRELISHDVILKYSNIWQDTIRDGQFTLTNTNRLVRYYSGCTGLKTGSTDKAGFCISATAERNGMHLIAVIMGSDTRDERNNSARALLDYGFANYTIFKDPESILEDAAVLKGKTNKASLSNKEFCILVEKSSINRIEKSYDIPTNLVAPVNKGSAVGSITYILDGKEIGKTEIYVTENIEKTNPFDLFIKMLKSVVLGKKSF